MILLVGSHNDDLLYVSSLLSNKKENDFIGGLTLISGQIFSQEILLVVGAYTQAMASAVVSTLLERYFINLVFVMGRCYSLNHSFKKGQIIISRQIASLDVDLVDVANVRVHTVPGLPAFYRVQQDVVGYVESGFTKRTLSVGKVANIYSTDSLSSLSVATSKKNKGILGNEEDFVVDATSFGVALSCYLCDIPCVSVKAVERDLSELKKIEDYVGLLDRYEEMGKAVVYAIGDIGRNDVLRMRK